MLRRESRSRRRFPKEALHPAADSQGHRCPKGLLRIVPLKSARHIGTPGVVVSVPPAPPSCLLPPDPVLWFSLGLKIASTAPSATALPNPLLIVLPSVCQTRSS